MMKILLISAMLFFMPLSMMVVYSVVLMLMTLSTLNLNNLVNFFLFFNLDLISMSMILLSFYIMVLMMLSQFSSNFLKNLFFMFIMLNLSLVFTFSTNSIILFYFFFEWSLIPIFFIILGWGYQLERMKSSFYLLLYTLFASLPLLIFIIILMNLNFSLSMIFISNMVLLKSYNLYLSIMLMSFLVKFPMFFFHQWLPKAHVEAPVGGSMILAGVLLKLGGYGLIRLILFIKNEKFILLVMIFSLLGGSILSIVCLMNSDMKVMIAYSSVVHMALIIVNTLSKNLWSILGAMVIMLAHGICSSGMFSCANMMYERSHSRSIMLNKAKLNLFPTVSLFWFILCMANFGGPFTLNLMGEILLIINLSTINFILLLMILLISFFSATYSIILYSNLQQGVNNNLIFNMSNFVFRELLVLLSHVWPLMFLLLSSNLI